jgi:cytoskeletal protein CcmA (bactofilin family)
MFSKSSKSRSDVMSSAATGARNTPFSIIGGDVVIRGDVEATVDLHIDGRIEGDIRCAALVQGSESRIKGQIKATSARIGGVVEGGISAQELVVEASARIVGDVTYDTISIAPGGQVEGRFAHMSGAVVQPGDLKLVKSEAS